MRLLKRFFMLALLAAMFSPMLGCAAAVGQSPADVKRQFKRTVLYDKQMLIDDLALATQTRRPMRTSRWVMN